jgi:hypothetical protein
MHIEWGSISETADSLTVYVEADDHRIIRRVGWLRWVFHRGTKGYADFPGGYLDLPDFAKALENKRIPSRVTINWR